MRLTKQSDYALRVLIFAASKDGEISTIEETADVFDISRAHLKKVVTLLTSKGFLKGIRGRSGGFVLAKAPRDINLGDVLKVTEADFSLFECFGCSNTCLITNPCYLSHIAFEALMNFMAVFERHTLENVMVSRKYFDQALEHGPGRIPSPPARLRLPWSVH